jgi:tRNA A-37 threonylcarbamoyl transferase component Bud32
MSTHNFYYKHVNSNEKKITLIASHLGVSPQTSLIGESTLKIQRYSTVLINIKDEKRIDFSRAKLLKKLRILHNNGIIHMDLSEDNVVVDETTLSSYR